MLPLADLAASAGADQLVIGTELVHLSADPELVVLWRDLIRDIRSRYKGSLTYAANWGRQDGEYRRIPFWDALDSIGVNGYFPLTRKPNPGYADISSGWRSFVHEDGTRSSWIAEIDGLRKQTGKPVMLTEIGYPSSVTGAARPWDYQQLEQVDLRIQSLAYSAALSAWSATPWLTGIYWWAWGVSPTDGGTGDAGFSPQGKPALGVLVRWYQTAAGGRCRPLEAASLGQTSGQRGK